MDALKGLFELLGSFAAESSLDVETDTGLTVAVEELFVNAVRHSVGQRGDIEVRLTLNEDWLEMRLIDENVEQFDITTAPLADLDLPISHRQTGGMGLYIVRDFADELSYSYENGNGIISLRKKLGKTDVPDKS
jgi:anti-sigma regulatory factor (Ser/Thr protein kinase)